MYLLHIIKSDGTVKVLNGKTKPTFEQMYKHIG